MKVIFVLHSHKAGGAERHLLMLMQGLMQNGVNCIYAGPVDGWLGEQLLAAGVDCTHIPYHGIYDVFSLLRLVKLIRREKADLVHGHLTRGAYYAGWAAKLAGIPSIATAHSTNAGKHFDKADRIIAVSNAVADFLKECGYAETKLRTVHHGVPDYAVQASVNPDNEISRLIGTGKMPIISMVARIERVKGHDIALEALARIKHLEWRFLIAGATDTSWAQEVKALATRLGIDQRVHFLGHVENVGGIYAATDILIAPSRREALSLTLLEASAFGLPIVATNVGGIGEAVQDNETGILVASEDYVALASAIENLLSHGELRLAMGRKARRRYEDAFSSATMIGRTISVYREVTQGT